VLFRRLLDAVWQETKACKAHGNNYQKKFRKVSREPGKPSWLWMGELDTHQAVFGGDPILF